MTKNPMGFADVNRAVSGTDREHSLGLEELLDDFRFAERIPTTRQTHRRPDP